MTEHKRLKFIEMLVAIAFGGLVIYLIATGTLSLSGLEHHWPYPLR